MEEFVVDTICQKISNVIQETAFENGYKWADGTVHVVDTSRSPYIVFKNNRMTHDTIPSGYKILSLEEFLEKFNKSITVGDHAISKANGKIYVKGPELNKEFTVGEIEEIYNLKETYDFSESCSVDVICPEISKIVQEKLFSLGYSWDCGQEVILTDAKYLDLNIFNSKVITYSRIAPYSDKVIPLNYILDIPYLVINHMKVIRKENGIQFGCTLIPQKIVEKIYKLATDQ